MVFSTEFRSLRINVMSSARRLILISVLSIMITFMSLLFLILLARTSIDRIKRYAESGQPCLTPLPNLK